MKRLIIGSIAVLIVIEVGEYVIHAQILKSAYDAIKHVWRPDMLSKMWIFQIIWAASAVLFTYIFARGYESRGVMEGLRYGAIIGLLTKLPEAYGQYIVYPIPYDLAVKWFTYGLVECMVMGAVVSLVYARVK